MTVEDWLRTASEDARRRGLAELVPMLETLARSMAALREADGKARRAGEDLPQPGGTA
jgi:hypothetical protein